MEWKKHGAAGYFAKVHYKGRQYHLHVGKERWRVGTIMRIRKDLHLIPLATAYHSSTALGMQVAIHFLHEHVQQQPAQ